MLLLLLLFILSCWIIEGIGAEDPPTTHYKEKNSTLCLKLGKSSVHRDARWIFNGNILVLGADVNPNYTDKVDFDPRDHSLCIKNLTATDSGIYKFLSVVNFIESTKTHRLIIEETVPRPVIRMSVLPSNLSAGPCRIMVNCSVQDDWVGSVCDVGRCRTSDRSLFRNVNITIVTENRSIVCRGSNHISTSNASEHVEATCFRKLDPEHEDIPEKPSLIIVIGVVCVSLCVLCVFFCLANCLHSAFQYGPHQAETFTAHTIQSQPVEAQPPTVPRVSTSSSSQAEACYENVDAALPCSPPISPREDLGSQQSQKVDTIYHVLQMPNVTSSQAGRSKDATGRDKTSRSVTLDEAEHPAQVDTQYSVLQKPSNPK